MANMDEQKEKMLILAVTNITVKNLCDLLIEKDIITKEEYKKIVDDANNILKEAFTEE